jgi:hypothetical protein
MELDDESNYNYTHNDVEWAWQGWQAARARCVPKLTEEFLVAVSARYEQAMAEYKGGISHFANTARAQLAAMESALKAAGVRFAEEP